MQIQFVNRQRKEPVETVCPLIEKTLTELIALEPLGRLITRKGYDCQVTVIFTGAAAIRRTNAATRGIDRVTDVLSYPMLELSDGRLRQPLNDADLDLSDANRPALQLGDILICLETARRQAEEYGHSYEREVAFLAVHGLLHLLGYDHDTPEREQTMLRRQRRVLAKLGLTRSARPEKT